VFAVHNLSQHSLDRGLDKWAFFVRNWGDEGACGEGEWPWNKTNIKVLFPRPDASDANTSLDIVRQGVAVATTDFVPGRGVIMTVQLPLPSPSYYGWVAGEATINWTPTCSDSACQSLSNVSGAHCATPNTYPCVIDSCQPGWGHCGSDWRTG